MKTLKECVGIIIEKGPFDSANGDIYLSGNTGFPDVICEDSDLAECIHVIFDAIVSGDLAPPPPKGESD